MLGTPLNRQVCLLHRILDRSVWYSQAMATETLDRRSARDRLLDAADELFYEEGVHTVGIDRVIERAGVAKASLYNVFGTQGRADPRVSRAPPRAATGADRPGARALRRRRATGCSACSTCSTRRWPSRASAGARSSTPAPESRPGSVRRAGVRRHARVAARAVHRAGRGRGRARSGRPGAGSWCCSTTARRWARGWIAIRGSAAAARTVAVALIAAALDG